MNSESVETFMSVIQHHTISAAAKALFVSQSTISHRIQVLEQELGITLFDRQKGFKRLELTADGEQFYLLAIQWRDLNSRIHAIHAPLSLGKVCIGSMDSVNQYLLPPLLYSIRSEIPELQMDLVSYHSQEIYSRITTQQIDVGFAFYPIRYNIVATPVFSEPMYMVAPPNSIYPAEPINPGALKKSDEIFFTWNESIQQWNNEWWDEHEYPYVKVDSCALLMSFLVEPERWTVCPASVAMSLRSQYNVDIHLFTEAPPNRICYMLEKNYGKGMARPKAVDTFVNAFLKRIEDHPWRYNPASDN